MHFRELRLLVYKMSNSYKGLTPKLGFLFIKIPFYSIEGLLLIFYLSLGKVLSVQGLYNTDIKLQRLAGVVSASVSKCHKYLILKIMN